MNRVAQESSGFFVERATMVSKYDASRVPEVLGGTITLVVLASISVAARILSRRISAANFWWDDWIIFVAMVRNHHPLLNKISLTT